jgi:hypothetical protein
MKQNIENNITKARKATGVLYPLLKKNSSVPVESKITLYRSYIRPIPKDTSGTKQMPSHGA